MGCAHSFFDRDTGEPAGGLCGEMATPCSVCGAFSEHLCDYPMGKGRTCDAPLCANHAIRIKPRPQNRLRVTPDPDCPDETDWIEFCPQHSTFPTAERKAGEM